MVWEVVGEGSTILSEYSFLLYKTLAPDLGLEPKTCTKDKLIKMLASCRRYRRTAFQRLSIAVQRGNAILIMGTFPRGENKDEVFYVLKIEGF